MKRKIRKITDPPIIIFQMGKVGSSSLEATLRTIWKGFVVHAHSDEMIPRKVNRLIATRRALHLPTYLICPVREPLSRNVSAFFQNWKRDTGIDYDAKDWNVEEITELFLNKCHHNEFFEFFDRDFRSFTGIDVLKEQFPIERKWKIYENQGLKVLIYRSDLPHPSQLEIVSNFLSLRRPLEAFVDRNISEQKEYSASYKLFKANGVLPEMYLNIMCESRICRHFWSTEEIETFKAKWLETRLSGCD